MRNVLLRLSLLSTLLAAPPISVMAQPTAHPSVLERQAAMKALGGQMRQASRFATGQDPWNPARVRTLMAAVSANAQKAKGLFPDASAADPKSSSSPRVWKEKPAFAKRFDDLSRQAKAAAAASSQDSYRALLQGLGGSCKGCHDTYRKSPA